MERLDLEAKAAPVLTLDPNDPKEIAELKKTWLEQVEKISEAKGRAQRELAASYASRLEAISKDLLRSGDTKGATIVHRESVRLQRLYKEPELSEKSGILRGHFYLVGEDLEHWVLYLNGRSLKMDDSKSEEVSVATGDIVAMKYPTHRGRGMMLSFLSTDRAKVIHLRAKNIKLFGNEKNPRAISSQKIKEHKKTLRPVKLGPRMLAKWEGFGLLSESSVGMMYDGRGDYIIAFEVKPELIQHIPDCN